MFGWKVLADKIKLLHEPQQGSLLYSDVLPHVVDESFLHHASHLQSLPQHMVLVTLEHHKCCSTSDATTAAARLSRHFGHCIYRDHIPCDTSDTTQSSSHGTSQVLCTSDATTGHDTLDSISEITFLVTLQIQHMVLVTEHHKCCSTSDATTAAARLSRHFGHCIYRDHIPCDTSDTTHGPRHTGTSQVL